jgi:AcrR family transcriptional regulator
MSAGPEGGTRERILEVAETLLGERGYHGTRLHVIAEQVGIQKASLFHYFPSKADLYRAVLETGFGEIEALIHDVLGDQASPLEKMRRLIESYVDIVVAHRARTKIFLRQSLGDAPPDYQPMNDAQRLLDPIVRFVVDGQRAGVFAPVDPLALVLGVVGMVAFFFTSASTLGSAWSDQPWSAASVERVKRHVLDVAQRSLLPDEPRSTSPRRLALA